MIYLVTDQRTTVRAFASMQDAEKYIRNSMWPWHYSITLIEFYPGVKSDRSD